MEKMTAYRRVHLVQCRTMKILRRLHSLPENIATRGDDTTNPLYFFRLLPPYRCERSKAIRNMVAKEARAQRRAAGVWC